MALVVARPHQRPPAGVDETARLGGQRGDLGVQHQQPFADGRDLFAQPLRRALRQRAVALVVALPLQAERREVGFQALLLRHHGREAGLRAAPRVERLDLVLQRTQHEGRPPPEHALGRLHVCEHVVADVQDLGAAQPEAGLHQRRVAADIGAPLLQHPGLAPQHRPAALVLADDLERGRAFVEEGRLPRADDGDVEQVLPGHVAGQIRVEGVAQDRRRVLPLRVGDEQHLLARVLLVEQRERNVRVALDEAVGVGQDLGLQQALQVGRVERLADGLVEIVVTQPRRQDALVQLVDQLEVDAGLGDRKERVHEPPAAVVEVDERAAVRFPLLGVGQRARPVEGPLDVAEAVGLDHVALLRIHHEPLHHEVGVEDEV